MIVVVPVILAYTYIIRKYVEFNLKKQSYFERTANLQNEIAGELTKIKFLNKKIAHYTQLEELIEDLNQCASLVDISNLLSRKIDQVFKDKETKTVFYIFHSQTGELGISFLEKAHMQINVKNKKGDLFDQWIVKAMQPLFMEDARNDARFSEPLLTQENVRSLNSDNNSSLVRSLIAAPLVVGDKALGILRVDSFEANHFTPEDLEFLSRLAGLGAMAIENAQLAERTEEMAVKDTLTGLYLRKYLMDRLAEEIKKTDYLKTELSFLMIDLDHFKIYNDQFGHIAGDLVLRTVAMILADSFRDPGDVVCRYGGEEFCAFFLDCPKQKAIEKAQNFRKRVEKQTIVLRRERTNVTVSIGIATFPKDTQNSEKLIHLADQAMYRAKKEGRNKVCYS